MMLFKLLHLGSFPTIVVTSSKLVEGFMRNHDHCFASRQRLKAPTFMFYDCKDLAFAPYGEYRRQLRKLGAVQLLSSKMVQSFHLFEHTRRPSISISILSSNAYVTVFFLYS
ncbi:hypothetical protein HPP92_025163 [Vanilla planifolia]|uniref:Uncharacterized protein n=1 Tax=Vanilla planifolia TaxID=51239 RepID=A0A835U7H4_VANPL|nr:hypothetical protein HPP92_025163 [Vanilla planifolia]